MTDPALTPTFAQPERRSFLVPILLALAALAAAAVIALHFFPATTVDIAHLRTDLLPTTTTYKAQSMVVGVNQTQTVLFVASTVRVSNQLRVPIFVDGFSITFTDPAGAQLQARGLTQSELSNSQLSFPALKPLTTSPLLRETSIDPGKSAEGTIVFPLPIPQSMWNTRKTATIKVDLYHQNPVYQDIPKPPTTQ